MTQQTLEERLESYRLEKGCKGISSNKLLLAASAVAGVGAILVPPPAEAAIVYSGVLLNNQVTAEHESYKVDFDADNSPEFIFELVNDGSYAQMLAANANPTVGVIKSSSDPAQLDGNYAVSSNAVFGALGSNSYLALGGSGSGGGNFINGEPGYLGIKFEIAGATHFGWIQYKAETDATVGTIIDWAYEDTPNKAIKAGSIKTFNWNLFLPAIINSNKND